jgi:hypothetical protein
MADAKDVTPAVFGLIIAYVLPGLFALFTLGLYSEQMASQLKSFSGAQSTIGIFFIVALASLLIGMQLHALRWAVFEKIIYRKFKLDSSQIKKLSKPEVSSSFRVVIDECYRYHQFYGAQIFIFPVFCFGVIAKLETMPCVEIIAVILAVILAEVILWCAAVAGLRAYIERANEILRGA